MSVLALELDHEDGSDAGDGPADPDVGAAVHLAHDAFEDAGADFGSAFVAEEESSGGGVGEEGEDLVLGGSEVGGGGSGAAGFGVSDEVGVRGAGGVEVVVPVGGRCPGAGPSCRPP